MLKIPFSKPYYPEETQNNILEKIKNGNLIGDGEYTKKCIEFFKKYYGHHLNFLLTTSCTHALECAALLLNLEPGDEVILPSFTFSSTANAFALRGAKLIFVDIREDTMNLDEKLVEQAITPKTKAIVPMHYAGVSCEMKTLSDLAKKYHLKLIEDSAQALGSTYQGQPVGSYQDMGCLSFHGTKNIISGEGGLLILNHETDFHRAEVIREKGTNRSMFLRGQVDKYTWRDVGSSYLMSDLLACILYSQLEKEKLITENRKKSWQYYNQHLQDLALREKIVLSSVPENCNVNGHIFYFHVKDIEERQKLFEYLSSKSIQATYHYLPLHSTPVGKKYGRFSGEDRNTTRLSETLVRLPLYYGLTDQEKDYVIEQVFHFFKQES